MLSMNPDIVCRLIELSEEFHAQEQVVIPEPPDGSGGDWSTQMLAGHAEDASYQEFKNIIEELEPDQQHQVVGLLWLGRGDYTFEEWDTVLSEARYRVAGDTADYLIGHPLLAEHLSAGLEAHGHSCH